MLTISAGRPAWRSASAPAKNSTVPRASRPQPRAWATPVASTSSATRVASHRPAPSSSSATATRASTAPSVATASVNRAKPNSSLAWARATTITAVITARPPSSAMSRPPGLKPCLKPSRAGKVLAPRPASTPATRPASARPINAARPSTTAADTNRGTRPITLSNNWPTGRATESSPSACSAAASVGNSSSANTSVPAMLARLWRPSAGPRPRRAASRSDPAACSMPVVTRRAIPAISRPMPSTTAAPNRLGKKPIRRDTMALTGSSRPVSSSVPSSAGKASSHTAHWPRSASRVASPTCCSRVSSPLPARSTRLRTRRAASQATRVMVSAPIKRGA